VVVGAGPGGLAAALEAASAGASVLLLEARDEIGGNGPLSTGYLAMVDIQAQRDLGIEDSLDQWLEDAMLEVERARADFGIYFDEPLWLQLGANTRRVNDMLGRLGFRLDRLIPRPLQHTVPRMWAVADTSAFERGFRVALRELGVKTLLRTRARRLTVAGGRIVGVEAETAGNLMTIEARQGVVLASGGFQANHEYRERYQPRHMAVTPYHGVDTCRGDAQVMASAIGADLINMTAIPPLVMISSGLAEVCIAVNRDGKRFHDECGPYTDRVQSMLAQPERLAYYICDGPAAKTKERFVAHMEDVRTAPNVEGMASLIGCDSANLRATIDRWNAFLEAGSDRDPETGRVVLPEGRLGILEPPFHVMKMIVGANFTCGGLRTGLDMGVLDVYGRPISGLFAAGDCVGSVNAAAGLGGIHIMGALSLGMIAGRSAAESVAAATVA